MKANLVLLLALFLVASSATAQRTDTLRTETSTEDAHISAAEVKLGRYAYFDINAGPEMLLQNSNVVRIFSFQLNALIGFGW